MSRAHISRLLFLAAAWTVAGALLAGCGAPLGGGSEATVTGDALTVRLTEYQFEPQDLTLPPRPIEVRVVNNGSLAHNWRIFRGDSEKQLVGTPTFQGGTQERLTVDLEPGTYTVRSTVGNQEELGMKGTIEVRRPSDR
ncbi:MAG: cupredoxin domain-containing protein [Solirubrobacterales bacterium]